MLANLIHPSPNKDVDFFKKRAWDKILLSLSYFIHSKHIGSNINKHDYDHISYLSVSPRFPAGVIRLFQFTTGLLNSSL